MTFVRGDAALAAKALADFRRASGLLTFKGGWMDGDTLTPEQIDSIARLPTREVLYGRLVGMVASPLTGLAAAMNGLIGGLARQLSQIAEQGLVGGPDQEPAPAQGDDTESEKECPEQDRHAWVETMRATSPTNRL
jgi:large subunit ribosomal protein L10